MKGLICAGGTATRLEELTRVTNKHLLPVGRWPMVYYPLQLLQRVGVTRGAARDRQAARGRLHRPARRRPRAGALDRRAALRARPQLQGAGRARAGSPRSSGWRVTSRAARSSSSASATTSSRTRRPTRSRAGATGRTVFVSEVDDPVNFGVVAYGEDGRRRRHRREGRRRRPALPRAAVAATPSSGSTATRPTCSRSSTRSSRRRAASSRSPTSTAPTRSAASSRVCRVEGWWHDGGKHWGDLADARPADRGDGGEQVIVERFPLTRHEDERGWFSGARRGRARCRSRSARRTSPGRSRA